MHDGNPLAKRAWWRDPRWIIAGLALVVVSAGIYGLFGPEGPIVVSRETTYLTGPLAADGLPDYDAAVLALAGPAPAPADNAAVDLLQVCWPLGMGRSDLATVCTTLGIPCVAPAETLAFGPNGIPNAMRAGWIEAASARPWTASDHPELAAWLESNRALLDRMVAAADKPRFWLPCGLGAKDWSQMWSDGLSSQSTDLHGVARALRCRALLHLGEGHAAMAWRDLRAMHRLARLSVDPATGPRGIPAHLAAAVCRFSAAQTTALHLLGSVDLPADLVTAIETEFTVAGADEVGDDGLLVERLMTVSSVVALARRQPRGRAARLKSATVQAYGRVPGVDAALVSGLDWNAVLRRVDGLMDRIDAAFRLPRHAAQSAEVGRLEAELRAALPTLGTSGTPWDALVTAIGTIAFRDRRPPLVADWVLASGRLTMPVWHFNRARGRSWARLARTAAALAAWRTAHGSYPDRLETLVPSHLPNVPIDPFTDTPVVYERRGDGYLLASVGPNGVFDGGDDLSGWIIDGEWQPHALKVDLQSCDFVVRVPVPPVPRDGAAPP